MHRYPILLFSLLLLAAGPAAAQALPAPDPPDLLPFFEAATQGWTARATQLASVLFGALFLLELVLSLYAWSLADRGVPELLRELGVKLAVVGAVTVMILNPQAFILPMLRALEHAGAGSVGAAPMTAAEVMQTGARLGNELYLAAVPPLQPPAFLAEPGIDPLVRVGNILADTHLVVQLLLGNLVTVLFVGAGVLAIELAFLALAAQLMLVRVESFVAISAGAFFLGFASFRLTAGLAEHYLRYALSLGVRLFLLYVIVGIGAQLIGPWSAALEGAVSVADPLVEGIANPPQLNLGVLALVVGSMGIFSYLAWRIPTVVARQLTGGLRLGLADGLRARLVP